ncbi:hypothetical protein REPUB_Repub20aG0004200 [Reevesia pubescens]
MYWDKKKAIEELERGRELTKQLRDLLSKSLGDDEEEAGLVGSSEDLVIQILNSFANTLSILRNSNGDDIYDVEVVSQNLRKKSWDGRKSEDSGESNKSTTTLKDRRGCHNRRKCVESWTRDTPSLIDDGSAWRKYGQKVILNTNHPRNYFRCTHKIDQGCKATKQVQKIKDDPPKYRTTYYGYHTCKNLLNPTQLILDSTSNDSSILLSFANNNLTITNKQDNPFFSSVKQESKEDHIPSDITYNPSSSSECLFSPDHYLSTFESSAQMTALSADHHDVISGVVDSFDLDDLLEF